MYTTEIMSIFFFNDTATTEIYTLSLHDALPISIADFYRDYYRPERAVLVAVGDFDLDRMEQKIKDRFSDWRDRKSTRLNSSHANISYAVFCLKNKQDKNY